MNVKVDILDKVRFDPTISLGHIASACIFIFSILAAWYNLRADVNMHTYQISAIQAGQEKNITELKQELRSIQAEIKSDIRDLRSEIRETNVTTRTQKPN